MTKTEKQAEIQELNERFANDEIVVLAHYSGLTVAQMTELRGALRKEGATFKVTKNSLARRALAGTKFEGMADMFKGPTGVASSKDPIAAAKVAYNFAKANEKFIILGGAFGSRILDAKGVEAMAKLPSLDEIRSKIVGLLQAPASKLVGVLQAPARQLVGVTKAYGEKG
ncbi:MAG: 50S ribosomal protein L10 [Alphaproteobacteria bacterium]|nr:50S ribosomal protein L10 [Alphaproteobacteria bacterium]